METNYVFYWSLYGPKYPLFNETFFVVPNEFESTQNSGVAYRPLEHRRSVRGTGIQRLGPINVPDFWPCYSTAIKRGWIFLNTVQRRCKKGSFHFLTQIPSLRFRLCFFLKSQWLNWPRNNMNRNFLQWVIILLKNFPSIKSHFVYMFSRKTTATTATTMTA